MQAIPTMASWSFLMAVLTESLSIDKAVLARPER